MKFSAKTAGLSFLALAYAVCTLAVFRHHEENKAPGKITIRIAQWQLESGVREAINALIKRYEQIHPDVHIIQIAVPGGPIYTSWVVTQMAGDTAPDLVEYSYTSPDVQRYFEPLTKEVLEPDPYDRGTPLEHVLWRDTFVDDMLSPDCYNLKLGEYYGIPLNTNAARIIYNVPLVKQITGSGAPPQTYREMLAMAAQVKAYAAAHQAKLDPIACSHDTYAYLTWMMQMAMGLHLSARLDHMHALKIEPQGLAEDYLRGEWSFDTPEMVALLQELKEFGGMCSPGFWDRERDTAVSDFVTERAAMIVAPSWEATNLLKLCKFKISVFNFPYPDRGDPEFGRFSGGPYSDGQIFSGLPIYLNRTSKHRAQAIDFLRFIGSVEGSTIFTDVSNWPPAVIDVKPSEFASHFAFNPNGYGSYANFLVPSLDTDTQWFIQTHYASLWSAGGTVDQFRQVLRDGLGGTIRSDLHLDISSGLENIRGQDTAAAAAAELAPPGKAPEVLDLVPVQFEGTIYQIRAVLAGPDLSPPGAPEAEPINPHVSEASATAARDRGEPGWGAARGRTGAKAGHSPSLREAWTELAAFHAARADAAFARSMSSADSAVAREARFGHAIALLDMQPVTPAQIEEGRKVFAELADSGTGDVSAGSRFFLGRIAQMHRQTPDPAEAARQYIRLLADAPDSYWSQSALAPLALLEIYDFGSNLTPGQRIARSESLLALARNPSSECEVQSEIAEAIFFYRLPAKTALPHLLAAMRTGRLDRQDRAEVLVQIAELSRLAGDDTQAVRFYQAFLRENPVDFRCFAIRKRLQSMHASADSAAPGQGGNAVPLACRGEAQRRRLSPQRATFEASLVAAARRAALFCG